MQFNGLWRMSIIIWPQSWSRYRKSASSQNVFFCCFAFDLFSIPEHRQPLICFCCYSLHLLEYLTSAMIHWCLWWLASFTQHNAFEIHLYGCCISLLLFIVEWYYIYGLATTGLSIYKLMDTSAMNFKDEAWHTYVFIYFESQWSYLAIRSVLSLMLKETIKLLSKMSVPFWSPTSQVWIAILHIV